MDGVSLVSVTSGRVKERSFLLVIFGHISNPKSSKVFTASLGVEPSSIGGKSGICTWQQAYYTHPHPKTLNFVRPG
jgi:hypothetical protein